MTQLKDRSFASRMAFAYMADALYEYKAVATSNTYDRFLTEGTHPYTRMWNSIAFMYDNMKSDGVPLSELSTTEFLHFSQKGAQLGFTFNGKSIDAAQVRAKAACWSKRGWFRYEEKRAEKFNTAKKVGYVAVVIALGMFGITTPSEA